MLKPVNMRFGTDPEGFFERSGVIIGSEKLIPKEGLKLDGRPNVVQDGVQFELNPQSSQTIGGLGLNVAGAFKNLRAKIRNLPEVRICYNGLVEVSRAELDSLTPESRILGCKPSSNIYGERPITVDAATYQKRSAAGHAHFGILGTSIFNRKVDERLRIVPIADIFLGNTCVMLDRDKGAAERRENYGRAGEYRLPDHGIEYRTPSNFWLRNYSLMSLVFGLVHMVTSIVEQTVEGNNLEIELIDVVDMNKVIRAIDTNNYNLARANFEAIRPFLAKHLPMKYGVFPLTPNTLDKFVRFTDEVNDKGLETFFPGDPLNHWVEGKFTDFHTFLENN